MNMIARRIAVIVLACIAMGAIGSALYGQQPVSRATAAQRRRHTIAREQWQMIGRRIPGVNSAALRNRAIQQKIQMRSVSPASQTTTTGVSGAWVSLGPSPLPSDASGIGLQDYGWVTGRATAVAIDPNDSSGNTVYAGGAYGGVWKSSNAGALSPIQPPSIGLRSPIIKRLWRSAPLRFNPNSQSLIQPRASSWLEPAVSAFAMTFTNAGVF